MLLILPIHSASGMEFISIEVHPAILPCCLYHFEQVWSFRTVLIFSACLSVSQSVCLSVCLERTLSETFLWTSPRRVTDQELYAKLSYIRIELLW